MADQQVIDPPQVQEQIHDPLEVQKQIEKQGQEAGSEIIHVGAGGIAGGTVGAAGAVAAVGGGFSMAGPVGAVGGLVGMGVGEAVYSYGKLQEDEKVAAESEKQNQIMQRAIQIKNSDPNNISAQEALRRAGNGQ